MRLSDRGAGRRRPIRTRASSDGERPGARAHCWPRRLSGGRVLEASVGAGAAAPSARRQRLAPNLPLRLGARGGRGRAAEPGRARRGVPLVRGPGAAALRLPCWERCGARSGGCGRFPPRHRAAAGWALLPRRSGAGMETGYYRTTIKTESDSESICMEEVTVKKTDDMADFMDDLKLSSPKKRYSCLRSERGCDRSSRRSSSRSSCSLQSSSSTSSSASSRSWSRSRSKSQVRRNSSRRYRRYSRSYSRSRSRSRGYMSYRGRYCARHSRRYHRSPRSRSCSRSWSRGRSYYRRSYSRSRSRSRGRRYYGFGRTVYPEVYRNWRSRSHTRSRSRSPLHLSEKEKRELLEIAKANAAKALGTDNIVLPASLKILTPSKETNNIKQEREDSGESDEQPTRLTEDRTKSGMERATTQRSISFSPNHPQH
ncbi:Arginine/serine-rich protein 1 [Aix galericulata]|nr:Arginine/serine-rich protein 1 [Aix galericulata]